MLVQNPSILTADGEYFNFLDPDPKHFTLNAIAQGLSNTCRFAGQCKTFYSVAEHSVHVSRLVPPEFALHALLHDAAEAFIGDVPTPLKRLLPDFQKIERNIEAALFRHFGLPETLPKEVKQADRQMLEVERRPLFDRHDPWDDSEGLELPTVWMEMYGPAQARAMFLGRACELGLTR